MLTATGTQATPRTPPVSVSYEMASGSFQEFPLTTELLHDMGCSRWSWLIDDTAGSALGQPIMVCTCGVAILLDQGGQL